MTLCIIGYFAIAIGILFICLGIFGTITIKNINSKLHFVGCTEVIGLLCFSFGIGIVMCYTKIFEPQILIKIALSVGIGSVMSVLSTYLISKNFSKLI